MFSQDLVLSELMKLFWHDEIPCRGYDAYDVLQKIKLTRNKKKIMYEASYQIRSV